MFRNPSDGEIRDLLQRAKTIAVVGASTRIERASYRIAHRLLDWGYHMIPVRPAVSEVLGRKAYATLSAVPEKIDLVDVFRNPDDAGPVVDECIALGVPAVWLQEGVINEAAALRAQAAGLLVVMDRCISTEYRRLQVQADGADSRADAGPARLA
jgi:predicted CoA-binding protein